MIETLLGGLLGGVTRFAPELLKFFDRKGERAHELSMLDKNLEVDKARAQGQLATATLQVDATQFGSSVDALKEAIRVQGQLTGNKIVDGINALVRPGVTYILFGMWTCVKIVSLTHIIQTAPDFEHFVALIPLWWTDADQAMLSSVLGFWFLGRVFDKVLKE